MIGNSYSYPCHWKVNMTAQNQHFKKPEKLLISLVLFRWQSFQQQQQWNSDWKADDQLILGWVGTEVVLIGNRCEHSGFFQSNVSSQPMGSWVISLDISRILLSLIKSSHWSVEVWIEAGSADKAKSRYHPIKVETELPFIKLELVNCVAAEKAIEVWDPEK